LSKTRDICITVLYQEESYALSAYEGEYRSLMALIYDHVYVSDFGECRGMGRCGTCVIQIIDHTGPLGAMDRNETATLEKMGVCSGNIRLACQIPLTRALRGLTVRILEEGEA